MAADRFRRRWSLATALCAGLVLTGCASAVNGAAGSSAGPMSISTSTRPTPAGGTTAPALPDCTNGTLPMVTPGTITIGTESPGRSPWYQGDPRSAQGLEPAGNTPAEFAAMIRSEIAKYAKIVKSAGIKAE